MRHEIDIRSLLCLVRGMLAAKCPLDLQDGLKQFNDVLIDHDMEPVAGSHRYFSPDYDDDPELIDVRRMEFCSPLEELIWCHAIDQTAAAEHWESLEEVDPDALASNRDNHALFANLSEAAKYELLGDEFEEYRACRHGPASAKIDLDVASAAASLLAQAPPERTGYLYVGVQNTDTMLDGVLTSVPHALSADLPVLICVYRITPTGVSQLLRHDTWLYPDDDLTPVYACVHRLRAELERLGANVEG